MQLVVDANILLAGFFKGAITRELLLDPRLDLFAPEHLLLETSKHLYHDTDLRKRLGVSKREIKSAFEQLTASIKTIPFETFKMRMPEAIRLSIHPEDAPYLALSLWKMISL